MRISDWSSDVCSSDLSLADRYAHLLHERPGGRFGRTDICIEVVVGVRRISRVKRCAGPDLSQKRFNAFAQTGLLFRRHRSSPRARSRSGARSGTRSPGRSEEHQSELHALMRNSYAVFCLKKKKKYNKQYKSVTT